MKSYFSVTFKDGKIFEDTEIYCTNIAHARNMEAVHKAYEKYDWRVIKEADMYMVEEAKHRHIPIIEID